MKFNIGDKIRVKSKEWYQGLESYSMPGTAAFVSDMVQFCGEVLTVIGFVERERAYRVDETTFTFSDWMLEDKSVVGEIKIEVSEGYEIDKELSSFERIVFKKKEETILPISWKEYCEQHPKPEGYCITSRYDLHTSCFDDVNILHAYTALLRLHKLRDAYRQGWKPDWDNVKQAKYCIEACQKGFDLIVHYRDRSFLAFQTPEIAKKFETNFYDLIKEASILL